MNDWVKRIRDLAQRGQKPEDLEEMIKKKLDSDPKYKRAPNTRFVVSPNFLIKNLQDFLPWVPAPLPSTKGVVEHSACLSPTARWTTTCHSL